MGSSRNSLTQAYMKNHLFLNLIIVFSSVSWINASSLIDAAAAQNITFLQCMSPQTSSYPSPLNFPITPIQNLRLVAASQKPTIILTPKNDLEIRKSLLCSKQNGLQIRVRSGGHDYEALSSTSDFPFIIIDLVNYRSISIDLDTQTAWVQAGATIGELSYRINEKSKTLAFPAGTCTTLGVGGHFSGGGIGTLVRKYGISADNIIDATILDVNGNILNRTSMGENLFWAIRGGSGASFGIILSWKIKLVPVPQIVTVFSPSRVLEQDATKLLMKWQKIAHKLPTDLFIRIIVQLGTWNGKKTVNVVFNSLYLGRAQDLLKIMQQSFPELGLAANDCKEMSWIESVVNFGFYQQIPTEILLNRTHPDTMPFKAKSDYVQKPIPQTGLEGLWKRVLEEEMYMVYIILEPFGGYMNKIPETAIPFPHRKGNLYEIQYIVKWNQGEASEKHIDWMRDLYSYMTPYVSCSPRAAYVNYRDLDLGKNDDLPIVNYLKATQWGTKYFKGNFKRLAMVKKEVDPQNYFNDAQSIPPYSC
ncbi:hypothetical protein MKX03_036880 [Papaver bracteatum]|nr:hypothetical protein MKX03_036880 [Papaver bracteatum]